MAKRRIFAIQAICGNEERWIKQWCESILAAKPDYVVVNLTQFDDNCEALLKKHIPVDKLIFTKNPWEKNFSTARNQAMELMPDDVDYFMYVDMDEIILPNSYKGIEGILRSDDYPFLVLTTIYNELETPGLLAHLFYPRMAPMKDKNGKPLKPRYDGSVHNQLDIDKSIPVVRAPIDLHHYGYSLSPEEMAKKHKRSQELLEQQIIDDPTSFFPHLNMAQLLRAKGDFHGTERHARKVIEIVSPRVEGGDKRYIHAIIMAKDQIATSLMAQRKFDESISMALDAIELHPQHLDSLMNLGNCHLELKHFEQALNWYKRYLFIRKSYDEHSDNTNIILNHLNSSHIVLYNIGVTYLQMNDPKTASVNFKKAVAEEPGFKDAFTKYIHCLRITNRHEEMNTEINKYVNENPNQQHQIYSYFGDVSLEGCDIEHAKFNYYQAANLVPESSPESTAVKNKWESYKALFGDLPDEAYNTFDTKRKAADKVNVAGGA